MPVTRDDLISPELSRLTQILWPMFDGTPVENVALDDAIAELALHRHQIGPLLFGAVRRGYAVVSPAMFRALRADYEDNARRHADHAARLDQIAGVFAARDVAWLSLKGGPQADKLYADRVWRKSSDIDLLVAPDAFAIAVDALAAVGYIASNPPMPKPSWLRRLILRAVRDVSLIASDDHACAVDLHCRLFLTGGRITALHLVSDLAHAPVLNAALACYLIVHGAQGFWVRLKWLVDLVPLFAKLNDAEKSAIPSLACRLGAEHSVLASLCLLQMLFPFVELGPLRPWVSGAAERLPVRRRLKRYAEMIGTKRDWRRSPLDNVWMTMAAWLSLFERPATRVRLIPSALLSSAVRRLAGALLPEARALTRCDVRPPHAMRPAPDRV